MKLLHIDSSVLGPHSVSRQVSAAIVERLRRTTPGLEVVYRDLTSTPLAHLSGSHLALAQGAAPEAALQQDLAAGQAVLESFWRPASWYSALPCTILPSRASSRPGSTASWWRARP